MPSPLRIFVSSPGDVREERLRAQLVIAKLARDYAGLVEVKPYFWESEPLRASGHFQDEIEPPSTHDIVVLILWSRLGTPLPVRTAVREYRGIDGRSPVTGTEWEFEDALAAFKVRHTPDLLVYRREGDPGASLTDASLRSEQERQWQALQAFWERHFENKGEFIGASARYDSLDAFDARLEVDLAKLIERRIRAGQGEPGPLHLKGPPYRGLSAYDFADAPVFFGRDGAIRNALLRLSKTASLGCAFLMVLGASGSGKSSLARAGLLPALTAAKAVPGVGLWRHVILRPGDAGPDPIAALAAALLAGNGARGEGLCELGGPGVTVVEFAQHLKTSSRDASYPFRTALSTLAERERRARALLAHEEARLVLLVDQLEELFTRPDIAEADRLTFVQLLGGLARSGSVWVIATMRSDLWHRAAAIPELLTLTESGTRFDLSPPDGAELLEMIRRPARATGLSFEENEDRLGLDAVLAEAAHAEPGALPLLSVVLEDLYRRDVVEGGERKLSFASYRAMGELTGAIATRAETAWWLLYERDPEAAAALPAVLRAVATTSTGEAVTTRAAYFSAFETTSPAARLITAFAAPDARLLVAEEQAGRAVLRLAHEVLLIHWPRAAAQIQDDRRDLETRSRLESMLQRYRSALGRDRTRAQLSGLALEEGIDLLNRWQDLADADLGDFIKISVRASKTRKWRGYTLASSLTVTFGAIAIIAGLQWREAESQRTLAVKNQIEAQEQAEEARIQKTNADVARVRAENSVVKFIDVLVKSLVIGGETEKIEDGIVIDDTDPTNFFLRAMTYQQKGDTEKAIADLSQAIKLRPLFTAAYLGRAELFQNKKNYDDASADIIKALSIDPNNLRANLQAATIFKNKEDYVRSILYADRAIELKPTSAYNFYVRGGIYDAAQKYELAVIDYTKALETTVKSNDKASIYRDRANSYYKAEKLELATLDYEAALKINEKDSSSLNGLGRIYYNQHNYKKAIEFYSQAIYADPNGAEKGFWLHNRAIAYEESQKFDDAIADYDEIIDLEPKNFNAYYKKGEALAKKGDHKSAIEVYTNALQSAPDQDWQERFFARRAYEYRVSGDYASSIADYTNAIKHDDKFPGYYSGRGTAYNDSGNFDDAVKDYSQAISLRKVPYATDYFNRGNSYTSIKNYDLAMIDYARAIELNPDDADVYRVRGYLYYLIRDYKEALSDSYKSLDFEPNGDSAARVYRNLGRIYIAQKVYSKAIKSFDDSLAQKDDDIDTLQYRAEALKFSHMYKEALADLDRSLLLATSIEVKSDIWRQKADVKVSMREFDGAFKDFDQAILLAPDNSDPYWGKGVAARVAGDYNLALQNLDRALQLNPANHRIYYNRANVYRALGDYKLMEADYIYADKLTKNSSATDAIQCLHQVLAAAYQQAVTNCRNSLEKRIGDVYASSSLGYAYLGIGDYLEAQANFNRSLDQEPKLAEALYGRGLARIKLGHSDEGQSDIEAANEIVYNIGKYIKDLKLAR